MFRRKTVSYSVEPEVFRHPDLVYILKDKIEGDLGGPCRFTLIWCGVGECFQVGLIVKNAVTYVAPGHSVWLEAERLRGA